MIGKSIDTDCTFCNWWGVAYNGKLCVKCGKTSNYIPEEPQFYEYTSTAVYGNNPTYAGYDLGYEPDAVHNWFGLTYASYLALPRAILQHMPNEWQNRFVQCLNELSNMVDFDDNYAVNLRDNKGKFKKDPLSQYRRFPKERVPWKKT